MNLSTLGPFTVLIEITVKECRTLALSLVLVPALGGRLGHRDWGAPGIQGLGPGMLNLPQCTQQSLAAKSVSSNARHRPGEAAACRKEMLTYNSRCKCKGRSGARLASCLGHTSTDSLRIPRYGVTVRRSRGSGMGRKRMLCLKLFSSSKLSPAMETSETLAGTKHKM